MAAEVQISDLKAPEWEKKLSELERFIVESERGLGYERAFSEIWVYVPTTAMQKVAEAARLKVDTRECIDVILDDELLAADEYSGWA